MSLVMLVYRDDRSILNSVGGLLAVALNTCSANQVHC